MSDFAALYLAHLNPMTLAHETIIEKLRKDFVVYVFLVRFVKDGKEVNTRSFPFGYELRKRMVESVFGNSVQVLPDYTFESPYSQYLPPLLSSHSWKLRNKIASKVKEKRFVSYTGDRVERAMLRAYRLHPMKADRLDISATSVREQMYMQCQNGQANGDWRSLVPQSVAQVIDENWSVVGAFSKERDMTKRVLGMKFPVDGYDRN